VNLYDDSGSIKIAGYARIFGVIYQHGDMRERIEPGAFDTTLRCLRLFRPRRPPWPSPRLDEGPLIIRLGGQRRAGV
jgi:hypothetical protein